MTNNSVTFEQQTCTKCGFVFKPIEGGGWNASWHQYGTSVPCHVDKEACIAELQRRLSQMPAQAPAAMMGKTTFVRLVNEWQEAVAAVYSPTVRKQHPNYAAIIAAGPAVIPFALEYLRDVGSFDLFGVLHKLAGEWPCKAEDVGCYEPQKQSWLQWGERKGYLQTAPAASPAASDAVRLVLQDLVEFLRTPSFGLKAFREKRSIPGDVSIIHWMTAKADAALAAKPAATVPSVGDA